MYKLFAEVMGRFNPGEKFEKITIDCNKIDYFKKTNTGVTEIYFDGNVIECDFDYYEFQKTLISSIYDLENANDIVKLMSGYLANSSTGSINLNVLVKDCVKILELIGNVKDNL